MIRPLRRAHRLVFIVLAVLLPIVLLVAIAGRETLETVEWPSAPPGRSSVLAPR